MYSCAAVCGQVHEPVSVPSSAFHRLSRKPVMDKGCCVFPCSTSNLVGPVAIEIESQHRAEPHARHGRTERTPHRTLPSGRKHVKWRPSSGMKNISGYGSDRNATNAHKADQSLWSARHTGTAGAYPIRKPPKPFKRDPHRIKVGPATHPTRLVGLNRPTASQCGTFAATAASNPAPQGAKRRRSEETAENSSRQWRRANAKIQSSERSNSTRDSSPAPITAPPGEPGSGGDPGRGGKSPRQWRRPPAPGSP